MNPIENLRSWWQNDPKAKPRLLFILGAGTILIFVFVFLYWVNFGRKNTSTNPNSQSSFSLAPQVTEKNFQDSSNLQLLDNTPLGSNVFWAQDKQILNFSQELKLRQNGQDVAGSPIFLPSEIYNLPSLSAAIINQFDRTSIWQNNQFKALPGTISQITPLGNNFVYLIANQSTYTLRQSSDLNLSQNLSTLGSFQPTNGIAFSEVKILAGRPFVLTYENFNRQGTVEIWAVQNGSLERVFVLEKIQSLLFSQNQILLTNSAPPDRETGQYETQLLDFRQGNLSLQKLNSLSGLLRQQSILGTLWAGRCSFDGEEKLLCLVKQAKVPMSSTASQDQIVRYQIKDSRLETPYSNLFISGETLQVQNGQIYLIGQQNRLLYQLS